MSANYQAVFRFLARLCLLLGLSATPVLAEEGVLLRGASQFAITSQYTGQTYTIYLSVPALPPPAGGYPVLYALDGDSSFPPLHLANPRSAAALAVLAAHGQRPPDPGIVVAIGYGLDFLQTRDLRSRDYLPSTTASATPSGADAFALFIARELKPRLAARFDINPARQSLLGHSYGGLFTLYQMLKQPAAFQRYFAISPSLWVADGMVSRLPLPAQPPRLLALWVGGKEQAGAATATADPGRQALVQTRNMLGNARAFAERLQALNGAFPVDFRVVPEHDHGEMAVYAYARVLKLAFAPD